MVLKRCFILMLVLSFVAVAHAGSLDVQLCKAAEKNNLRKAMRVLQSGAQANTRCWWGRTPLHEAARHREGGALLRLLVESGADVTMKDSSGETPLHEVMSLDKARRLIEAGADVNAADDRGSTPIVTAVLWEELDLIRYLLEQGADVGLGDGRVFDVNITHTRDHVRRRQIHLLLSASLDGRRQSESR